MLMRRIFVPCNGIKETQFRRESDCVNFVKYRQICLRNHFFVIVEENALEFMM